jgi:hypothetical protein
VQSGFIFIIDSDEIIDSNLKNWLLNESFSQGQTFVVKRENLFCGKIIRHGHLGPDFPVRLFEAGKIFYEDRAVHARLIYAGRNKKAKGSLLHNTNPTIEHFVSKMVAFTKRELPAREQTFISPQERPTIRKNIGKFRGLGFLRFFHSYIIKLGFLEGVLGFQLAMSAWYYEILVSLRRRFNETE